MRWGNFTVALLLVHLATVSATAQGSQDSAANFNNCLTGITYRCDPSLLTDAQQAAVTATRQAVPPTSAVREAEKISAPGCAENGSCYGDISEATGRPKTVHVNGYYRRDGTYVRGHYRSRPSR